MNFKHINKDIFGTSLQGYVSTTYATLVEKFGQPNIGSGDKTNAEWALRFSDGTVATIYDYKEPYVPTSEYAWHVGGNDHKAVHRVCAVLGTLPDRYF